MDGSGDDKAGMRAGHGLSIEDRFSQFVSLIAQINRSIRQIKSLEMHDLGLRGIHVMILFHLDHSGSALTQADLANLCFEDKATISRATTDLIDKGFVEVAQPTMSHRNVPLRLTDMGRRSTQGLAGRILRAVEAGSSGLTSEDTEKCYRILGIVNDNLTHYLAGMRAALAIGRGPASRFA